MCAEGRAIETGAIVADTQVARQIGGAKFVRIPNVAIDNRHLSLYAYVWMIVSFKHKGLKRLHEKGDRSQIGADLVRRVENILATLDAADSPRALDLPGYRLHPLKDDRKNFWAVTVRANWRIIFRFESGDFFDVELVDYH